MTRMMGLQFKIIYRQGKENLAADALSRIPALLSLPACTEVRPLWLWEVINSYATDQFVQDLIQQLALSSPNSEGYSLYQGIIRLGQQIWVGENSVLRTKLIHAFHSSAVGGHSGVQATYNRLKKQFQWRGMKHDVDSFVKQCCVCQQVKHERVHPVGLLQPLSIPEDMRQDISMDFIEGLPKSEGFNSILVVVDILSKYAHFIPLKHPFTEQ
jgi:hypothetical protein